MTSNEEKNRLIAEIGELQARKKYVEDMIEKRKGALSLTLAEEGTNVIVTSFGKASLENRRSFSLSDPKALAEMIPAATLAENFKPSAFFYDGAKKAGINIDRAISVTSTSTLRVDHASTPEITSRRSAIIEEERRLNDAKLASFAEELQRVNSTVQQD